MQDRLRFTPPDRSHELEHHAQMVEKPRHCRNPESSLREFAFASPNPVKSRNAPNAKHNQLEPGRNLRGPASVPGALGAKLLGAGACGFLCCFFPWLRRKTPGIDCGCTSRICCCGTLCISQIAAVTSRGGHEPDEVYDNSLNHGSEAGVPPPFPQPSSHAGPSTAKSRRLARGRKCNAQRAPSPPLRLITRRPVSSNEEAVSCEKTIDSVSIHTHLAGEW